MWKLRDRSSPAGVRNGKIVVLVGLLAAAGRSGAVDLDLAEGAWRSLELGQSVPLENLAAAQGSARARWVGGTDARLRELESADPARAAAAYAELLSAGEARGDSLAVLVALERLVVLELDSQPETAAEPRLERCERLAAELDQPMALALARLNLGRVLVRTREMDRAAEHLESARQAAMALGLPRWRGDAALSLSVIQRLRMDLDGALALREEAYAAYTEAGDQPGRARALHFIGTTHAMRGELTRAMVTLQAAEDLARSCGDPEVLSGCLGDQAGIHFLTGDFARAQAQYREAGDLTTDPRRQGWYLTNLASILAFQGQHAAALPRYEEALALVRASGDRRTESTILLAIGQSRCVLGDLARGLADLDSAVAYAREFELPLDEAKALEVKGHALIDEDLLAAARPLLEAATERADALGYFDLQESARAGLAEIARREGRLDVAQAQLEHAVATVLQVRRRSGGSASVQSGYFSQVGRSFDALVDVLYDRHVGEPTAGHAERAWEVAQQGRGRWLLDLLAETEVDLRLRADPSFRERETAILDGIAGLEERRAAAPDSAVALDAAIRRLESRLEVLEADLRAADPRYANLRYPQPVTLSELRESVLEPGEAILEFQLGARHSHAWLISDDRFIVRRLPAEAEIESLVRALVPLLQDPSLTGADAAWYVPAARAAARALLDPFLGELAGVRRVIVVPDGLLHYLPLEALPVRDSDAGEFARLPWLVELVELATTPSVSALAELRRLPPLPGSAAPLLLLADPALPSPAEASVFVRVAGAAGLAPVPGATAEARRLADLYGERARVYTGVAATADRLRTAAAGPVPWRSVHLATHGLFNEERPQYSGLVLAATGGDDGFLDVAEIFALDLACDQVVLSACSSALGELVAGEGLVGLSQAFLYAGAHSVVAALWDVGGDGAAEFMAGYYARLTTSATSSRTQALAATKRGFARDPGVAATGIPLAHPNLWAAFSAIGDAR
ncbi:MAG TPA: CHAT domain-containing protein [Candidatus Krumholzibacteria bacterium]|nr:CHAT domain-containing protein [Candidatus Krumholzibacteria bacterium]HPD70892.1 CHAT domain-containing protein [Candidatus Krumholzibacteria bacterium]HRY39408.1 CHAT domain-containing protein [Candidatus Krumholzibacteria bacterium]